MSLYQSLPQSYEEAIPLLQRVMQENASAVLPMVSTRKRPDPPRSLIAQQGSLETLITWNAPQKDSDVAGWKVYKDNESNLVATITDPMTRQYTAKLPASTKTYFYVSSINAAGRESIKVQVLGQSNTDQMVTSGTGGGTSGSSSSPPPGYPDEPSGGLIGARREQL